MGQQVVKRRAAGCLPPRCYATIRHMFTVASGHRQRAIRSVVALRGARAVKVARVDEEA